VWVSDWGANAILRFDPKTEKFEPFSLPDRYAGVRQLAGRKGEVWGARRCRTILLVALSNCWVATQRGPSTVFQ
jgi:virginiamycin B lyase